MSTNQTAVMLCGWGVTAGRLWLVCRQTVYCLTERFRKYNWYFKTLYKCPGLLYFFTFIPLAPMPFEGQYNIHIRLQLASDKTELFGVQPKRIVCISLLAVEIHVQKY